MIFKRIPFYALIIFLHVACNGTAQTNQAKKAAKSELIKAATELMTNAKTCALITTDDEGRSRVRAMDPFAPEDNLVVWFGTNVNSRKVTQIKNNSNVTLYYLDEDATGYVMILGIASLVNDPQSKKDRFKEQWKDFYPNYPDGYLLIKVTPQWMEIVSETRGILGDDKTWEPQKVVFD